MRAMISSDSKRWCLHDIVAGELHQSWGTAEGKKGKYSANMFALAVGPHCGHSVAPISAYPRIVPPKGSGDNRNSDRGDDSGYCGPGYPANGERTVFIY